MDDKTKETPEERAFRHQACDALRLPRQTRYVVCAAHGERARIEDAYSYNNVVAYDNGDITCEPTHPFCFGYCSDA